MSRRARRFLLALAALLLPQAALAQRHVALIVDNNPSAVTAALPVATDAAVSGPTPAAIARRLAALNYTVMHAERLDAVALREHIEQFRVLAEKADVAVFYFHGQAIDVSGRNHLLPETAAASTGARNVTGAVVLDDIADRMKAARANVLLLDAGYNDPAVETLAGGESGRSASLANVGERANFLIVMASAPGKVVRREGRMRFSKAILAQLDRTPGDWSQLGGELRRQVFEESRGEQLPYVRSSIRPGVEVAALPSTTDAGPSVQPVLTEAERHTFLSQMQQHLVRLRCYPQGAQPTVPATEQALTLLQQHATAAMPPIEVASAGPADFAQWLEWAARFTAPICPPPRAAPAVPAPRVAVPQVAPPVQNVAPPRQQAQPPRVRQPERVVSPPRQPREQRAERSAPSRSYRNEGGGGYRAPSGGGGGGSGRFSPGAF